MMQRLALSTFKRSNLLPWTNQIGRVSNANRTLRNSAIRSQQSKQDAQQKAPGTQQLIVRFATPSETLIADKPIHMIIIPSTTGVMGLLAEHSPTIAQLNPGVVDVYENDVNTKTASYFISGGFAIVKADSTASILAVEALKLDDLDILAAKRGIDECAAAESRATNDQQKVEAQIQREVFQAVISALEQK